MSQEPVSSGMDWDIDELAVLYNSSRFFSASMKKKMGLMVPVVVYLQDPLVAEQARLAGDEHIAQREEWQALNTIYVPGELDLMDGPTSSRIEVFDYDATTQMLEDPAGWDSKKRRFFVRRQREKIFLDKEHCDLPQFHQVNVWAIVQKVLSLYEDPTILGRSAPWAFEGNRIRLVPHAGEMRNAFYNRATKSIAFHYFHANGKRVDTCLSHDIIAHETGHAILDGLRPLYNEDSSIQTSAFHEFIADTTAILAAFLNNELRFYAAQASGGDMSRDQVISGLAEEFGYYSYGRPFLRSAQNTLDMGAVQASTSQYDWSMVLTGAMFDILKEMLAIRMFKLRANGEQPSMKAAFSFVCNRFRRVAFQPLDYLPPVDVQFSDYARAVLKADQIVEPRDEDGYREAMTRVFQSRGIDCSALDPTDQVHFYAYDIDQLTRSRTDAYYFLNNNRRQLCIPADQDISVVDLYQTDKLAWGVGKLPREIVVQYAWREDVPLTGPEFGRLEGERTTLLCGGTLIFDSRGNLLFWQHKPGAGKQETGRRLRRYCEQEQEAGSRRRDLLLAYVRDRIAAGRIRLQGESLPVEPGEQPPVVARHGVDGRLHFGIPANLRH